MDMFEAPSPVAPPEQNPPAGEEPGLVFLREVFEAIGAGLAGGPDGVLQRIAVAVRSGIVGPQAANSADDEARAALAKGDPHSAAGWAHIAATAGRLLGQRRIEAYAAQSLGESLQPLFRLSLAATALERAIRLFDEASGYAEEAADARVTLARVRASQGQMGRATRLAQRARGYYGRYGHHLKVARCDLFLGEVKRDLGQMADAERLVSAARAVFSIEGTAFDLANCDFALGLLCRRQRRLDEGESLLQAASARYAESGSESGLAACRYALSQIRWIQGRQEDAERLLVAAETTYVRLGFDADVADLSACTGHDSPRPGAPGRGG
jgi:tetratricopeptide (TPR) repeat protein